MNIKSLPLGPVQANTYIITEETGHTAVIDAGDCNERLLSLLRDEKIESVDYILLTHGHFDHIDGVAALKKHFPDAKIAIHAEDAPMLCDDLLSLAAGFGLYLKGKTSADIILSDGVILPFGKSEIKVIHTPGHTKGSVTYMIDECLFTGDTLFYLSVGRTDFPGGSYDEINSSCCRLFDLSGEFTVYPGHDIKTNLNFERQNNRFVNWSKR